MARPVALERVAQHRVYSAPDFLRILSIDTLGLFSCGRLQHRGRPCIRPSGSKSLASFHARDARPRGLTCWCRGRVTFSLSTRNRQFLPLIPVQQAVNVLNAKIAPETSLNSRFSIWNVVAILLGGSFVVLSIVGIAMTNKR